MKIEAHIIYAFANSKPGGNPAGVVLDADNLTKESKQSIAAKIGMSETAFVSHSTIADFKLEFFTPVRQIAHCGHATIGTFSYLKQIGRIHSERSSKETIDGVRAISFKGDKAYMEQGSPGYSIPTEDMDNILSSLRLKEKDLIAGLQATIANTGNSFLLVPVRSEEILRNIQVDSQEVSRLSEKYNLIGFYPYTTNVKDAGFEATTRMFGPYYGIPEEAATGMAAGPLGCFLYANGIAKTNMNIQQGKFMFPPSSSLLNVTLNVENGEIQNLYVGGTAYYSSSRTIEI